MNFTWNLFHVNFKWNCHMNFTWNEFHVKFMWNISCELQVNRVSHEIHINFTHGDFACVVEEDIVKDFYFPRFIWFQLSQIPLATQSRIRTGERVEVSRPPSVENYHNFIGGKDRNNQLRAKAPMGSTAKKWWMYIFFVLNLCITNPFIFFKKNHIWGRKNRYTIDFRIDLAKELIGYKTEKAL